ncbi:hypothetical protein G7Y89_g6751 [Cudoniella acicularis]|uniref:Uncharacterized protein n=1 Tax=Cudoniella acicularis TaxID=354080 RepID=A0A8H4W2J8_9HELO|nr:hypothetical protein G7Y89_g6751 [Cudoniella acicularis]
MPRVGETVGPVDVEVPEIELVTERLLEEVNGRLDVDDLLDVEGPELEEELLTNELDLELELEKMELELDRVELVLETLEELDETVDESNELVLALEDVAVIEELDDFVDEIAEETLDELDSLLELLLEETFGDVELLVTELDDDFVELLVPEDDCEPDRLMDWEVEDVFADEGLDVCELDELVNERYVEEDSVDDLEPLERLELEAADDDVWMDDELVLELKLLVVGTTDDDVDTWMLELDDDVDEEIVVHGGRLTSFL